MAIHCVDFNGTIGGIDENGGTIDVEMTSLCFLREKITRAALAILLGYSAALNEIQERVFLYPFLIKAGILQ